MAQDVDRDEQYRRELAEDRAEWDDFIRTGKTLSHVEVRAYFEGKIQRRARHSREER